MDYQIDSTMNYPLCELGRLILNGIDRNLTGALLFELSSYSSGDNSFSADSKNGVA